MWEGDDWFFWFIHNLLRRSTSQQMLHEVVVNATLTRVLGAELAISFRGQILNLGLFFRIDNFAALYDNQDLENILEEYRHQFLDMLDFDILSAITIYFENDDYITAELAFVDRLLPGLLYSHHHALNVIAQWGIPVGGSRIIEFTEDDLDLPRTMSPVLNTMLLIDRQQIPEANLILSLRNDSSHKVMFDISFSTDDWVNTWRNDILPGEYVHLETHYYDRGMLEGEFTMMFTRDTQ